MDQEKEQEHSSVQEKLDRELKELDKRLEQKEAEMKRFASSDTSVLKQHYEKKVHELELEKRALQKEIDELRHNLANISSTSDDGAQKLKENYLQKLNVLESQVSELKKKQDAQAQLLRQKQKSDEAAKRLQDEIQRIKSQKVQLQHKIKQESEQFRLWKASREKEVLQLKKEGRRNEYEMHKLLALNQRQKMVLQRKTEEASMATKRLKELLESRKASSREVSGANGNGPGVQALMQAIEHELEVTVRVHEVRTEYERQMEERARMAKEVARLKEEVEISKQANSRNCIETLSPGARNSRIYALENMLDTSSSTLVSMASQLSEAEERERGFSGRGRWNQVRSLSDAKNLMNYLFNLASSSRCLLRDKEVACREKDSQIRDLKGKVVNLSSLCRKLEMQNAELVHQVKSQKNAMGAARDSTDMGRHKYDLRKQDHRSSFIVFEDMDTSESEKSDADAVDDDGEWVADDDDVWVAEDDMVYGRRQSKKRNSRSKNQSSGPSSSSDQEGKLDSEGEGIMGVKTTSGVCCTCSKSSSCKTNKCQCRSAGGLCGPSCGCVASKCTNRDETEQDKLLASHGAMLLESALIEKPAETKEDGGPARKPLSDIGNTEVKSNVLKPNKRKKWRTSTIQLVTNPPPASQPDNSELHSKPDNNSSATEPEIPVRLPRAMRAAATSGVNVFRERNADKPDESSVNKESAIHAPRSPVQRNKTLEEKENFGH